MTKDITLPKILLVEDQDFLAERITESLVFAGYDVTHVDCANHAMRAIDQRVEGSQIFDCIVLDYYLHESKAWPDGMDGTFVLTNFKRGAPEDLGLEKLPPVIAHSSEKEKGQEMLEKGADAYVKKGAGISDEALIAKIEELLAA